MAEFKFSSPMGPKPPCWGMEAKHDPNDRECRTCDFHMSCRDEIIRLRPRPYNTYYGTNNQPTANLPIYNNSVNNSGQVFRPNVPQSPSFGYPYGQRPVQSNPSQHTYGWFADPLHNTIAAHPAPMRVQVHGETFVERAVKNTLLALLEAFFIQCLLVVRQLIFPPKKI